MTRATPPTGSVRANVKGRQTRERLLEAALRSFATAGFHGTSTRDLASAAGMSPAAVYAYYGTKEELLFEISLSGHTEVLELVSTTIDAAHSSVDGIAAVVREFVAWHARFRTQARVVQYEMAALTNDHREAITGIRRETQRLVRDLIAEGVASGDFHVDNANLTALALLSLGIDVARWYRPDGAWSPEDVGENYSAIALRMVGWGQVTPQG